LHNKSFCLWMNGTIGYLNQFLNWKKKRLKKEELEMKKGLKSVFELESERKNTFLSKCLPSPNFQNPKINFPISFFHHITNISKQFFSQTFSNDSSGSNEIFYYSFSPCFIFHPLSSTDIRAGVFHFRHFTASPLFYIPNSIKLFQNTPELSRVFFPLSFLIKTVPLTVVSLDSWLGQLESRWSIHARH